MHNKTIDRIERLYLMLGQRGIISQVIKRSYFYDEPKINIYSAKVESKAHNGNIWYGFAGGFSFFSKELALLKCLSEAAERYCNASYETNTFIRSNYRNLSSYALDPSVYTNNESEKEKSFMWLNGLDLLKNKRALIPAQLIYFTYKFTEDEPQLLDLNSTGAAGGFGHDEVLLRAIYEVIERDAFLCVFLAKLSVPSIDISNLKWPELMHIIEQSHKYNLDLRIYDITNDLGIPVIMTILIDRTGIGPAISIGLKASLSKKVALIGSIEEAFHTRPWVRMELFKNQFSDIGNNSRIINILQRAFYWAEPGKLKSLSFFLDRQTVKATVVDFNHKIYNELDTVKRIICNNQMSIFFADISDNRLLEIGYRVYKVLIPQLQFFYINEANKRINHIRIRKVASYFGQRVYKLNQMPHPFL